MNTYYAASYNTPSAWLFLNYRVPHRRSSPVDNYLNLTIDKMDFFFFGYSKLHKTSEAVRIAYSKIAKPGVRFLQEEISAIDSVAKRVTTNRGTYDADAMVVALGSDYDVSATPGLAEDGYELFLGVPKHCAPAVVASSGLTDKGWIPVNPKTLETKFPGVYAIGDVISIGTPKTGGFSESAARVVAAPLIADLRGNQRPGPYTGTSTAYLEFGAGRVGRLDFDFFSGPSPQVRFTEPSTALARAKEQVELRHLARWFGL